MRHVPVVAGLALLAACTHNVDPRITPARVGAVQPPLRARALMLITPSFEGYVTQSQTGIHHYNYQLGTSATVALSTMIGESFEHVDVRRMTDAESVQWLAAAPDTTVADCLIVPRFERGGYSEGLTTSSVDVRLRLDVRSWRTGAVHTYASAGRSARVFSSRGGLAGSALEQAVAALADTLSAHRAELDVRK